MTLSNNITATALSEDKVFIAYNTINSNSKYFYCKVCEIAETNIIARCRCRINR
ncbi:MAG: hypothetical protein HFJ26_09995 [Clostridia bacterium]|nr:hypothetical protein [Clostridia bacterium]